MVVVLVVEAFFFIICFLCTGANASCAVSGNKGFFASEGLDWRTYFVLCFGNVHYIYICNVVYIVCVCVCVCVCNICTLHTHTHNTHTHTLIILAAQ